MKLLHGGEAVSLYFSSIDEFLKLLLIEGRVSTNQSKEKTELTHSRKSRRLNQSGRF